MTSISDFLTASFAGKTRRVRRALNHPNESERQGCSAALSACIRKSGPIDGSRLGAGTIREPTAADAAECGRILYAAFAGIANQHNFSPDFPSVAVATDAASMLIAHPGVHGLVAEEDGRIVGSNFMDQRS